MLPIDNAPLQLRHELVLGSLMSRLQAQPAPGGRNNGERLHVCC